MKTKVLIPLVVFLFNTNVFCQRDATSLTFTAILENSYLRLDSIRVKNLTHPGDTMLYWPDTVMWLIPVGISIDPGEPAAFRMFQTNPGTGAEDQIIYLSIPIKGTVEMTVTDLTGRSMHLGEQILDQGLHKFRYRQGVSQPCLLTAWWNGHSVTIKTASAISSAGGGQKLEYLGSRFTGQQFKSSASVQQFSYSPGDKLLSIGYANGLESGIPDTPSTTTLYTFQFATNIPCPGIPTVTYGGQVYNTIQIFSQCWMKENLNIGVMVTDHTTGNPHSHCSDNGTIEKYCHNNDPAKCTIYGGLYEWGEMMDYETMAGSQGICPPGWHLPTDDDWQVLEGAADSFYGIGHNTWNMMGLRGLDAGKNLKATTAVWPSGNGTDLFGFMGSV